MAANVCFKITKSGHTGHYKKGGATVNILHLANYEIDNGRRAKWGDLLPIGDGAGHLQAVFSPGRYEIRKEMGLSLNELYRQITGENVRGYVHFVQLRAKKGL